MRLHNTAVPRSEEGEGEGDGSSLDIAAALNLRTLKIVNAGDGIIDFSIKNAPILETIILDFEVRNEEHHSRKFVMKQVFGSVPRIVRLELHNNVLRFLKRGRIPRKMAIRFDGLRYMWLGVNFRDNQELLVTLCLLRRAPNLQEFELKGLYLVPETRRAGKVFLGSTHTILDKNKLVFVLYLNETTFLVVQSEEIEYEERCTIHIALSLPPCFV